jgi:hypothetical protein
MNRIMGMNAHGGDDLGVAGRNTDSLPGRLHVHPGNGHGPDPGVAGPVEHGIHVFFKTGVINVTVRVEQYHDRYPYAFKCKAFTVWKKPGYGSSEGLGVSEKLFFSTP